MSAYPAGTVAVATVRGVPNQRVIRYNTGFESGWYAAIGLAEHHQDDDVTDVRPLIVLDLYNSLTAADVCRVLREDGYGNVAEQIEAQTKPPRIPEPAAFGSVVEAGPRSNRRRWLKVGEIAWRTSMEESPRGWEHLIDPVLIRDGIEDGAS